MNQNILRPSNYIIQANKKSPNIWKEIDSWREIHIGTYPDWCFVPFNDDFYKGIGLYDRNDSTLLLPHLAAWRTTQGIYRFDPAVYESLINTSINADLPSDLFKHMPEWCVYIETNDFMFNLGTTPTLVHGFFACITFNIGEELPDCLLLILDLDLDSGKLFPLMFPTQLAPGIFATIEEMIELYLDDQGNNFYSADPGLWDGVGKNTISNMLSEALPHLFSLLLYLCCTNAEFYDRNRNNDKIPQAPVPKKTKQGLRHFPPDRPTVWETAWRIGAAIRSHRTQSEHSGNEGTGETKRPHIRRAHWHTFWIGPRDGKRDIRVKWLPPISVNVESTEDLIPAIRPVE